MQVPVVTRKILVILRASTKITVVPVVTAAPNPTPVETVIVILALTITEMAVDIIITGTTAKTGLVMERANTTAV